jgi:hypothetical protein
MIPCICIDDTAKPGPIPFKQWVIRDNRYHITHVFFHPNQQVQGVELKEVKLGPEASPYETYRITRFGFTQENFQLLIQMMKDCSKLNEVDIKKLLEEVEVMEEEDQLL